MEGKFTELELAFIDDQLDQHGEYVRDLLMDAIEARNLIKTGDLSEGITWRVGMYGLNPHLEFSFPDYGRFQDIAAYKKKSDNTDKWTRLNQEANRALMGQRVKKKMSRRRKDTRFYASTVYGAMNTLIGKIMYEFTDYEMERMKKAILTGNNLKPI
jgi:hypothetical protein